MDIHPQIDLLGIEDRLNAMKLPRTPINPRLKGMEVGFMNIGMRLRRDNSLLREYCDMWYKIKQFESIPYQERDIIDDLRIQEYFQTIAFLQEEVIYHAKVTCDNMVALSYILGYLISQPNQTITDVQVDCIGALFRQNSRDPYYLNDYFSWLSSELPFLKQLNTLANAGKHSVLNSLQMLRLGTEEPVFVLTSLPSGKLAKREDCWMTACVFADGMSRVYRAYFDYFDSYCR